MVKKILIIGDTIIDEDINLKVIGLSLESPTFKTKTSSKKINFGGAANVARYASKFGLDVDFLTCMSVDSEKHFKNKYDINLINIDNSVENRKTRFYIEHGDSKYKHLQINETNSKSVYTNLQEKGLQKYDLIAFSDYRCGLISKHIIEKAKNSGKKTFGASQVSGKKSNLNNYEKLDYIVCNESESDTVTRRQNVLITKGDQGCEMNGTVYPAYPVKNVETIIGAGDCFYAAFLAYECPSKSNELASRYVSGDLFC